MLAGCRCVGLVDADGGFVPDAEPARGGEVEALSFAVKDGQDPALRIDFVSRRVTGVRREDIDGICHLKVSHVRSLAWVEDQRLSRELEVLAETPPRDDVDLAVRELCRQVRSGRFR